MVQRSCRGSFAVPSNILSRGKLAAISVIGNRSYNHQGVSLCLDCGRSRASEIFCTAWRNLWESIKYLFAWGKLNFNGFEVCLCTIRTKQKSSFKICCGINCKYIVTLYTGLNEFLRTSRRPSIAFVEPKSTDELKVCLLGPPRKILVDKYVSFVLTSSSRTQRICFLSVLEPASFGVREESK